MVMTDETMPSDETQTAWCALFRSHKIVLAEIESKLKTAQLPQLLWYDLLWQLEQASSCGVRAFELQPKLFLPQYGMSRLVDRIEAQGLIEKHECPEDGRGIALTITDKGREVRKQMWAVYAPAMQKALGAKLSKAEIVTLVQILGKLSA